MTILLPNISLQKKLQKAAFILLLIVFLIALLVLAGWAFSINSLKYQISANAAMNPLSAVFFLFIVTASFAKIKFTGSKMISIVNNVILASIFVITIWKILSIFSEVPFTLDLFLFKSSLLSETKSGVISLMAPNTAFCFTVTTISVLLLNNNNRILIGIAQVATITSLLLAFFCILGYLFGAAEFYEVKNYTPMAPGSALCFVLFSLAILFVSPSAGLMQQFTSIYTGSYLAWRLLIPAFLLPVIFGLLRLEGQRRGFYDLEFGLAIFVTCVIVVFLALIWVNTFLLNAREQKQSETVAENNHLANLVEQTSDAILSTDTSLNIKSWNKGAEEIYGYSKEEVLNKPLGSFLKSTLSPETTQQLLAELLEKGYYTAEYEFFGKQQQVIFVQASVTVLRNANKEVTGYVAVHRDITQRKMLEQQLQQFNQQLEKQVQEKTQELRDVFERISEAFFGIDNNSNIIYVNTKAEQLFGKDGKQLTQTSIFNLFKETDGEIEMALREAFANREYIYLETLLPQFDKWFELHIYPSASGLSVYLRDITIRKKALRELNASEEKYRMFFENSMDGILITSDEGKIYGANKAACEIFGMTEDEICSVGRRGILDESDENWAKFYTERSKNGKAQGELKHYRKDGTSFLAEITSVKFKTASGEEQANTIIRDITERRIAQEALNKSEEKYRNVVEQAGDGIIIFEKNGTVLEVNESVSGLLGYSKNALAEFTLEDILDSNEFEHDSINAGRLAAGESIIWQRKMKHRNGSFVEMEIRAKKLHDGTYLAIIRDLTDRLRVQKQLQKEKDLLNSIINNIPGIFYFYDANGKFISWNKKFEEVTEYSASEIAQIHPLDFFEGEDKIYLQQRIGEVFTKGISEAEALFVTKSGKRIPYFFTGARIEIDDKICLVGMGIDITDRKLKEQELHESYQQIRRLTAYLQNIREEERANIAREIHDELGQQLTVIMMDVSWMKKRISTGDLAAVPAKMNEMLEILDGTVATVRRIATELRPSLLDDIGLIAAIEWQIDVFSKRTGIKVSLVKLDNGIEVSDAQATGLFRILQESLTNITRYANASKVDIHLINQNKEFTLCIQDNGQGFDMEEILNKKTLGLLGMRERSIAMHGTFTIQSKPGQGTRVEVKVPIN